MKEIVISMKNISLNFDGQTILDNAEFYVHSGEVCSLMGENGAGKSSLMKVLAGIYKMNSGNVSVHGVPVDCDSVTHMQQLGVYMIQQEPQLVDGFTVEQNIFNGNEVCYKNSIIINKKYQKKRAREILNFLQSDLDENSLVGTLSLAQKKIVEIAKALSCNAKILILDEVSAAFSINEFNVLMEIINNLKKSDIAIVYISHKLEEVLQISDRFMIMRDGRTVGDTLVSEYNKENGYDDVLSKMAGKDYINRYPKTRAKHGDIIMKFKNISNEQKTVTDVSMYVREGEIVGIAGLQGAGKSSLAKLLSGVENVSSGKILFRNELLKFKRTYQYVDKGIIYLSALREDNLILGMNVEYNMSLASLKKFERFGFIWHNRCAEYAKESIKRFGLKKTDPNSNVKNLSRGTQQKVAIAKWLCANVKVFVMDEPSINLDIASKVELYNIMNKMSQKGIAIILASSDLSELIGMCDRIYVMYSGSIVAELNAKDTDSIRILQYALGRKLD